MIISTKSFELAIYAKGDVASSKLALILPGRLDTKDYVHMRSLVDHLSQRGYYAVSFDPPGTWESPGDSELYTTTNYLIAINELITYFDNRKTVLIGHSRGGSMAMLAGVRNPYVTHFAAIMSHHGPTTTGTVLPGELPKISTRDLPPGTTRTKERKTFTLSADYFQDQLQYDVLEDLKTCVKPKLFVYGTKDELVSARHVKEMYRVAAEPKRLEVLETEHDYRLHPEVIEQVNQTVAEFLGVK